MTVASVLGGLDDEFADFAEGFCAGEYLLWLGSGISRDVVPNVPALLRRMLEYLRGCIDSSDPGCRFRKALEEVLEVGAVPPVVRASLDLDVPVDDWDEVDDIVGRLVDRYSDVLNVQVADESEDFLVWTGLDVPGTYANAGLEPDVEHLCVAILMLEGVVHSAPTTNWDGLVEAAMNRLTGDVERFLQVIVSPDDFRESPRPELVKFHGCAVRAVADEAEYRSRLIARKAQIAGWSTKPENQLMKQRLEFLYSTRSSFIVGLSAQDANIHTVLNQAIQNLDRTWPTSPPTVVFAEQGLHYHHKHVLQVTYGESYAANAEAIGASALLGSYAKPALVALVLYVLADKLTQLMASVSELSLPPGDLVQLQEDLRRTRDAIAERAEGGSRAFVEAMVSAVSLLLAIFRSGVGPDGGSATYQPLTTATIADSLREPDFPAARLGRLAVAVSLLGRGIVHGDLGVEMGSPDQLAAGVLGISVGSRGTRAFLVANSRVLSQLEVDEIVDLDDDDVLIVQAEASNAALTRSPRASYGRTGTAGARVVDLEELCATVSSADELYEAFRHEGGL